MNFSRKTKENIFSMYFYRCFLSGTFSMYIWCLWCKPMKLTPIISNRDFVLEHVGLPVNKRLNNLTPFTLSSQGFLWSTVNLIPFINPYLIFLSAFLLVNLFQISSCMYVFLLYVKVISFTCLQHTNTSIYILIPSHLW